MTNKKKSQALPDFEETLKKLESIVAGMEGSKLSLEQSLAHFEEGVSLIRTCQQALRVAELRVQELTSENDLPLDPFIED